MKAAQAGQAPWNSAEALSASGASSIFMRLKPKAAKYSGAVTVSR